jgi:hypothetical protein
MLATGVSAIRAAAVQRLLEQQRSWAARCEIELEGAEHVRRVDDQLFRPLSGRARAAWARELAPGEKPGELHSLLSSAALVCNLFDEEGDGTAGDRPQLRVELPSAPSGRPPRADALLSRGHAVPIACFVRYREAYEGADNRVEPHETAARAPWGALAMCRALAADLASHPRRFATFPAAELLRATLALTARYGPRGFRLLYVWHELAGRAGREHRREVDRFRMRVGGEVDFEARTLREVIRAPGVRPHAESARAAWLEQRYLAPPAPR